MVVLLLAVTLPGSVAADDGGWTSYGNGAGRASATGSTPVRVARRFVLPLPGRITGQVLAADGAFLAATSSGRLVSFTADGFVRWQVELGQLAHPCPQLDGYGVTGTGVVDPSTRTLYVADAFGRLHALSTSTGAERRGWPVRVFDDDDRELVWGALSLVHGSVYVPTASYCDAPMTGGLYRVVVATRKVSSWVSVPASLGGGGGVWGWGGSAFSPRDQALYVVTANAFAGGSNTGEAFSESAGYGEQLVRLAPDLSVQAASHPPDLQSTDDLDFVGSPVVVERPGCDELVVGADKDGEVYAWRGADVGAGPVWQLALESYDAGDPFLAQLAWSKPLRSLYAVTGRQLVRIEVGTDCRPRVAWRRGLGTRTENGSPTVAGNRVWFTLNGRPALVAYDARSGRRVYQAALGGTTLSAPTVVYGRIVVGTFTGLVEGFEFGRGLLSSRQQPTAASVPSWAGALTGWQGRASGVYATENGGTSWHRISTDVATRVLRLSAMRGVIEVPVAPSPCMCATRKLWTDDNGRHWHETRAVGERFAGNGDGLYWWDDSSLYRVRGFPPRGSTRAARVDDGRIVDVEAIPSGVAAVVSNRVGGRGWDDDPRVLLVRGTTVHTVRLPEVAGDVLLHELAVRWPELAVGGLDFGTDRPTPVRWTSVDGGETWTIGDDAGRSAPSTRPGG